MIPLAQSSNWFGSHTANMFSAWQWALLGLVPPAIILLYFLKLRRHPLVVPSTYLWRRSIEDLHVNSIWQRLRKNLLLLLQLLLILLVALAVLRPSVAGRKLTGERSIFVIDNSASMQAVDVKPSRLAEAKRHVRGLIDEMRSGDVAMLVSFSDVAKIEQPYTDDRRALREALERIQPTERRTDLGEALRVAAGLANPGRSGTDPNDIRTAAALPADLYIFSDGGFAPVAGFSLGNLKPTFVPVGAEAATNLAITAFGVGRSERDPQKLQAFGRIENLGAAQAGSTVELHLDGRLIDADRVDIPAGQGHSVAFDLSGVDTGTLRLRVSAEDDLPIDNEAFAVVGVPRQAEVLMLTPGNRPLELALQTGEVSELARVRIETPAFLKQPEYQTLAGSGALDWVIYDRCQPERLPTANTLFVGSLPPVGGWSADPKTGGLEIIDIDQSHPLLQWLDLGNVHVFLGSPLKPPQAARVLVDSDVGPLLAIAPREAYEDAVLAFPIVEQLPSGGQGMATDWPSRISFPTFMLNCAQYLGGARRGSAQDSIRPGDTVTLESPSTKTKLSVMTPRDEVLPVPVDPSGKAAFTSTGVQGIYRVQADRQPYRSFPVNLFDPAESNLALGAAPSLSIGHTQVAGQVSWEPSRNELWKWILLLGLAVLAFEWWLYNRRVYG
ncbi:MAG: vWA domain-containing protein [Planctomycetota bacterium]